VPDLLAALKRIEARGFRETAHRVRSTASNVFRYAVATGRTERDISTDLRGALAPVVIKNRAAITVAVQIGQLMRMIYAYRGQRPTEAALKLAPLFFVRPTELRAAEWSGILESEGNPPPLSAPNRTVSPSGERTERTLAKLLPVGATKREGTPG
jgi:integrase